MKSRKKILHPLDLVIILTCVISFFTILFFPFFSNLPEIYEDIIIETLATSYTNRSFELYFFYALLGICILITILKNSFDSKLTIQLMQKEINIEKYGYILLLVLNISYAIYYGNFYKPLTYFLFAYTIIYHIYQKYSLHLLYSIICTYYGYLSLVATLNYCVNNRQVTLDQILFVTSGTIIALLFFMKENKQILHKYILMIQISLPFIFLTLINDRYSFDGEIFSVPFDIKYTATILSIIVSLFIYTMIKVKKHYLEDTILPIEKYIYTSSIICFFSYNSFSASNLIMSTDLHHNGENFFLWHQIKEFDTALFSEIIPASGLFPLFFGFINEYFNSGDYISTTSTSILIRTLFAVVTILMFKHIYGPVPALIASIFFCIPSYNRVFILLPCYLMLNIPKLKERRSLWIPLWIFMVFCAGLYYALYGVALLLGTLPLGIYQCYQYVNTGEIKSNSKSVSFSLIWFSVLCIIILNCKILLGIIEHSFLFSDQTMLADSISISSSKVPAIAFPYIQFEELKLLTIIVLKHILLILPICLIIDLLYSKIKQKQIFTSDVSDYFFILCLIFISYSYTLIRMDQGNNLSARSSYALLLMSFIAIGSIIKSRTRLYFKETLILSMLLIFNFVWFAPFSGINRTIPLSVQTVPNGYKKLNESDILPNLGIGFINEDIYNSLIELNTSYHHYGMNEPILVYSHGGSGYSGQGFYFITNIRAASLGTMRVVKSFETQSKVIKLADEDIPLILSIDSISNYYIYYHYFYEKGYRKYDDLFYMAPETAEKYYGPDVIPQDILKSFSVNQNLTNIPASLGMSINTLLPIFDVHSDITPTGMYRLTNMIQDGTVSTIVDSDPLYTIILDESIHGAEGDFLYLELDTTAQTEREDQDLIRSFKRDLTHENLKVRIYWETENYSTQQAHSVVANYGDGKLLFPMGAYPTWLFEDITKLRIAFEGDFTLGDSIEIKSVQLLKLDQDR